MAGFTPTGRERYVFRDGCGLSYDPTRSHVMEKSGTVCGARCCSRKSDSNDPAQTSEQHGISDGSKISRIGQTTRVLSTGGSGSSTGPTRPEPQQNSIFSTIGRSHRADLEKSQGTGGRNTTTNPPQVDADMKMRRVTAAASRFMGVLPGSIGCTHGSPRGSRQADSPEVRPGTGTDRAAIARSVS